MMRSVSVTKLLRITAATMARVVKAASHQIHQTSAKAQTPLRTQRVMPIEVFLGTTMS